MKKETYNKSRVLSFSDAVFSIAVTLLILEVGIPTSNSIKQLGTLGVLQNRIPSFLGLIISFLVIVLYWVGHLRIMKFVTEISNKLLWYNIYLLFFIILLPFSTAFYVQGFDFNGPFVFYCFNLTAIGLFNYLINAYVIKTEKENPEITPLFAKYMKKRALNAFLNWLTAGVVSFVLPNFARFIFIFLFIVEIIITKQYHRKLKKQQKVD